MPRSITSSPARRFSYINLIDLREQVRRQTPHAFGHFDRKRLVWSDRFALGSHIGHKERLGIGD